MYEKVSSIQERLIIEKDGSKSSFFVYLLESGREVAVSGRCDNLSYL